VSFASDNLAGKRKRITGVLEQGPRRLQLVTEAGDRWSLVCEDFEADLIGQEVTAEGVLIGLDRLKVDWLGEALA
jgi:Protein of unknown function (DUF5818)